MNGLLLTRDAALMAGVTPAALRRLAAQRFAPTVPPRGSGSRSAWSPVDVIAVWVLQAFELLGPASSVEAARRQTPRRVVWDGLHACPPDAARPVVFLVDGGRRVVTADASAAGVVVAASDGLVRIVDTTPIQNAVNFGLTSGGFGCSLFP